MGVSTDPERPTFPDPLADRYGSYLENLESLTDEELRQHRAWLRWRMQTWVVKGPSVYQSRSYAGYRHNRSINRVDEILERRRMEREAPVVPEAVVPEAVVPEGGAVA